MKTYNSLCGKFHMHADVKNVVGPYITHLLHNHNQIELFYLCEGAITYSVESFDYSVTSGDVMVVNSNEYHQLTMNNGTIYNHCVIMFDEEFVYSLCGAEVFSFLRDKPIGLNNYIPRSIADAYSLPSFFEKLSQLSHPSANYDLLAKCVLIELLLKLNDIYRNNALETRQSAVKRSGLAHSIVVYINDNLSEKITLSLLAQKMHFSKYYIEHIFKKHIGVPINDYVSTKRVLLAASLIRNGATATEACYKSGYNNYPNFYRAFVKIMGRSPKKTIFDNKHQV